MFMEENEMNDKKNVTMFVMFAILVSGVFVTYEFMNSMFNIAKLSKEQEILSKYEELYDKVDGLNKTISSLENSYDTNVYRIYTRIVELCKDDPDEIRDAVIESLVSNTNDSSKLEASILALLENYTEFKSDIEIQTYLNDNVNILGSIERYETIQEGFTKSLEEYNKKYLEENVSEEKEKG